MSTTIDLSAAKHLDQAERLSAFLDGELSDAELSALLDGMDDSHYAELKRYHLISDVMRDGSLAIRSSERFSMRLAEALAAEPAHVAEASSWEDALPATGTDGGYAKLPVQSATTASIHQLPAKPKARLAFVAGGVAAAIATVMTYSVFQSAEIQSGAELTAPALVSSAPVAPTTPASTLHTTREPVLTATTDHGELSPVRSFRAAPTVVHSASAAVSSARAASEEYRRTYPEYLRSHRDMSAQTPFMQVNYQGAGFAQ
ncbi:sigma-E factor negative regulatory protein [Oligella urethralis]|uniref:sigma-E factor negative regulatory protein n=1 Tax=Oligella urethralis TaxID=90245 RepID=UPI00035C6AB2|nr:sigma-E factor negative regulatory protein [Oligella urethralis]SUA65041.1 anti-RNA polymerase sigma factor SigE [Oligella urethralis]